MSHNANWELAEKVAIYTRLKKPYIIAAVAELGLNPESSETQAVLRLAFRAEVLDVMEKTWPLALKQATGEILKRSREET